MYGDRTTTAHLQKKMLSIILKNHRRQQNLKLLTYTTMILHNDQKQTRRQD